MANTATGPSTAPADLLPRAARAASSHPPQSSDTEEIYAEFERYLARWRRRYAGQPESELVRLYLLALEREENVVVAYGDSVLARRLARLPVAGEVRRVIQDAIASIREDEERHARHVRGSLSVLRGPLLGARTSAQRLAGIIGGWTVAVRQHRRWSEAPLAGSAAALLVWVGYVSGRVPRAVHDHLTYGSVRDFCVYNARTERTAWLCWHRLTELAALLSTVPREEVGAFRRIAEDENRHREIFRVIAEALDDDDRLRASVTAEGLSARIRALASEGRGSGVRDA